MSCNILIVFSHLRLVVVLRVGLVEAVHARLQGLALLRRHPVAGGPHHGDLPLDDPQPLRVQLALPLVVRLLHLAERVEDHLRPGHPVGRLVGPPVQRDGPVALDGVRRHVQHVADPPDAVEIDPRPLQGGEDLVKVGDAALVERLPAPLLHLRDLGLVLQNGLPEAVEGLPLRDDIEGGEAVGHGAQNRVRGGSVGGDLRQPAGSRITAMHEIDVGAFTYNMTLCCEFFLLESLAGVVPTRMDAEVCFDRHLVRLPGRAKNMTRV